MRIALDIRKTVDENAAGYFERAKKDKKKIEGARKVIADHHSKLADFKEAEAAKEAERESRAAASANKKKAEWFEKFRWFISSDGFLVIGGRDVATNEIVIKKHTDPGDLVFHTDMAGSPFVVVKLNSVPDAKEIPESTKTEAFSFAAVHSRGWKLGFSRLSTFCAKPEQVTKSAKAGESLSRGAFYIEGSVETIDPEMNYAIGVREGKIMGGPISAVKAHCQKIIEIIPGDEKNSDLAKAIIKRLGTGTLDEIIRVLPQGCKLRK